MNNTIEANPTGMSGVSGEDLKRLSETFGKYTVIQEEPSLSKEETERRERVKLANRIYKKACSDSGMNGCFFTNFATWSDYVQGKIEEAEFSEKARVEAQKMKEAPNTTTAAGMER